MKVYGYDVEDTSKQPFDVTYRFDDVDFGAGNSSTFITSPGGRIGIVRAIAVTDISETFTAVTTEARVDLGTSGRYGSASLGTTPVSISFYTVPDADAIPSPPGGLVSVNFVAPTGGVPAGIGSVAITISWFKPRR